MADPWGGESAGRIERFGHIRVVDSPCGDIYTPLNRYRTIPCLCRMDGQDRAIRRDTRSARDFDAQNCHYVAFPPL
jgi:hypothetical protein